MSERDPDILNRILRYVDTPLDENSCWITNHMLDRCGYSRFSYNNQRVRAHRVMWEAYNSQPIPKNNIILHSCDNPSCVNPNHLRLGTCKDNMEDRSTRGRNIGPGKHQAKLTKEEAEYIINSPLKNFELAKIFNLTAPSIRYHRQKAKLNKN